MLKIPHAQLDPDTLKSLLEEYATRNGTDYGVSEVSTEYKVEQLSRQLNDGRIVITWDAETESCTLLTAEEAFQLGK